MKPRSVHCYRVARRRHRFAYVAAAALLLVVCGCQFIDSLRPQRPIAFNDPYLKAATSIEYPDTRYQPDSRSLLTPEPLTLSGDVEPTYRDISLEEAIRMGLSQSKVIRDIGGMVLRSPLGVDTTYDTALVETDPRFGIEAALSEFDAQLSSSVLYEHNNRPLNNMLQAGVLPFKQRTSAIQTQLMKRTAVGGEVFLRNNIDYNHNNGIANFSETIWEPYLEAGFRQSLLRGAGVDVNRIAGSSRTPGIYNGVLIARTNADISIADFEISVRNFVSDVENAYWDLYYAYRNLDAKKYARDAALRTWQQAKTEYEAGRGAASNETQAREQYFRFEEDVQNALTGRLTEPTHTHNGSPGGTFRQPGGVYVAERRLRYLIDLPLNQTELLRPTDEPISNQVVFDWETSLSESLMNRPELRRQKWLIKQRELELIAARNFLKPQLDVVGLYRWRGFGRSLLDPAGNGPSNLPSPNLDDATTTLVHGDFQEWQLGVELSIPIGHRRAHAGVRNAEFRLAREQALLQEQEHLLMRGVSNAFADVDRSYQVLQTVRKRYEAAQDQVDAQQAAYDRGVENGFYLLLDAQRRHAQAESQYYEALVEHGLAIRNMHFEKGSLLEYAGIHLAEGPWSRQAHEDAQERLERRMPVENRLIPGHRVITEGPDSGQASLPPTRQ